MRAKAEILESMKKTSLILSEMVKGTSYEKEFNALNSFSNEELTVKAESLILKTKFMIKNTKPNVDYASINKLFQFTEENLNFIKKNPLENVKEYNFLFQSSYKEALCMFLTNEGLCNRVQNKRIDNHIELMQNFSTDNSESKNNLILIASMGKDDNYRVYVFEDARQLKIDNTCISFSETEFFYLKQFLEDEFHTIHYKDLKLLKQSFSDYVSRINKIIQTACPDFPKFIENIRKSGYKISPYYKISKRRKR